MNTSIKNKILNISQSPENIRSCYSTVGTVIKADEYNNTCKVSYNDNAGNNIIDESMNVQLDSGTFIGWFPKDNDDVNIMIIDGDPIITGPFNVMYSKNIKGKANIKKDMYSDTFDAICGLIL